MSSGHGGISSGKPETTDLRRDIKNGKLISNITDLLQEQPTVSGSECSESLPKPEISGQQPDPVTGLVGGVPPLPTISQFLVLLKCCINVLMGLHPDLFTASHPFIHCRNIRISCRPGSQWRLITLNTTERCESCG